MNDLSVSYTNDMNLLIHGQKYLAAYHENDSNLVIHDFLYYFNKKEDKVCFIRDGWYFYNVKDDYYELVGNDFCVLGYLLLQTSLEFFIDINEYKKFSDLVINKVLDSVACSVVSDVNSIIYKKNVTFAFNGIVSTGNLLYELDLYKLYMKYNKYGIEIDSNEASEDIIKHLENLYLNNTIRNK